MVEEEREVKEPKETQEPRKPKKSKEVHEGPDDSQEKQKNKGKLKGMLFLAAIIVLICGGLGAGYYFFGNKIISSGKQTVQGLFGKKPPAANEQRTDEQSSSTEQSSSDQQSGASEQAGESQQEKKKEALGPILSLDPFVFNMSGNQSKYAKVTLGLEVKDPKVQEETKKMIPVIRDKILSILGTKSPEGLMDVTQRNATKGEILKSLKSLFKDGEDLKAVYITDIILQ
ncbi:MAG TPA: flagellar basal body-associated FliL family protein [Syntrophorhabdaceae bacterium]|nr:flagellar basal body-associated FliL family protein [Syntrophorhabdaceae bacterium]